MNNFLNSLKKMIVPYATQLIIQKLIKNKSALAKKVAKKIEIPLLSEKKEIQLATIFIDDAIELIESVIKDEDEDNAKG